MFLFLFMYFDDDNLIFSLKYNLLISIIVKIVIVSEFCYLGCIKLSEKGNKLMSLIVFYFR